MEFDGPDITKRWTLPPADQMVKYTTALRLGTAETEAILRRFTRNNVQHPTYKGLAELGKAIKTIFLCHYFHSEALRREIHKGLNVIEQWNDANNFVFFARRSEADFTYPGQGDRMLPHRRNWSFYG